MKHPLNEKISEIRDFINFTSPRKRHALTDLGRGCGYRIKVYLTVSKSEGVCDANSIWDCQIEFCLRLKNILTNMLFYDKIGSKSIFIFDFK